jgi:membrane protein DedA with SNARE-associated domain/rhodanese-related sulfurtransferase
MLTLRHALWLVALNTLLHEIGVPVPLAPTVLVAGAGAISGGVDPFALIAAVVAGTVLGNSVWFAAGRRYGSSVLKLLCRLSLSPDACVVRTEDTFRRWGWSSLVVGRFIPGVSLVAPPLAGALGMSWSKFIVLSAAGAALWALVVVGAGMLLHEQLDAAIRALDAYGLEAVAALVVLLAMYLLWRWRARQRTARMLDVPRIAVGELQALIDRGESPLIVDVRGPATRQVDPRRIPTAIAVELRAIQEGQTNFPRDREIVLYCACPNEAGAAHGARALLEHGYERARPLLGGLDAWVVAGHAVDTDPDPTRLGDALGDCNARAALAQPPRVAVTDAAVASQASDLRPTSTN